MTCPSGYYCLLGTSTPNQYPCPAGTLNPSVNATSLANALPATPESIATPLVSTQRAATALLGTTTERQRVPEWYCRCDGRCWWYLPLGYYCLTGTPSATSYPLLARPYQPLLQMRNESACLPCQVVSLPQLRTECRDADVPTRVLLPIGLCRRYVLQLRLLEQLCDVDVQVSALLVTTARHIDSVRFFLLCPAGTYSPAVGSTSCLNCPQGYYCAPTTGHPSLAL